MQDFGYSSTLWILGFVVLEQQALFEQLMYDLTRNLNEKIIFSATQNNNCSFLYLTHWGLVTSYGDRDLGQHWLR